MMFCGGTPAFQLPAWLQRPSTAPVQVSVAGVTRSSSASHSRRTLGRDDRALPDHEDLAFDAEGWVHLAAGTYGVRYGEWVALPNDAGGLCFPRSSLLRMGVHVPTAVWDAGYAGRGEGLLVVSNPHGVRLERGARIVQLVMFSLGRAVSTG